MNQTIIKHVEEKLVKHSPVSVFAIILLSIVISGGSLLLMSGMLFPASIAPSFLSGFSLETLLWLWPVGFSISVFLSVCARVSAKRLDKNGYKNTNLYNNLMKNAKLLQFFAWMPYINVLAWAPIVLFFITLYPAGKFLLFFINLLLNGFVYIATKYDNAIERIANKQIE